MIRKIDIDKIIHDKLLGVITKEDNILLQSWLKEDQKHLEDYNNIVGKHDLYKRYISYSGIDDKKAWKKFKSKHQPKKTFAIDYRIWKYAAAIVFIMLGTYLWIDSDKYKDVKPVALSETVEQAIKKSENLGLQKAELTVDNQAPVNITNLKAYQQTLAKSPADVTYTLTTHDGNEFWITLDDGSRVHLNYDTHLKYPSKFASDMRVVYLDGEAYFKISKDARPFIVMTNNGEIKEYGTEFNVNTRINPHGTEVVLIEGSISVRYKDKNEHMMKPNERVCMVDNNIYTEHIDVAPYKAWNEGEYMFRDTSMDILMNVLGHWYNMDVKYLNDNYKTIKFTGNIDRYGKIESILKAISKVTGLNIERDINTIVIK